MRRGLLYSSVRASCGDGHHGPYCDDDDHSRGAWWGSNGTAGMHALMVRKCDSAAASVGLRSQIRCSVSTFFRCNSYLARSYWDLNEARGFSFSSSSFSCPKLKMWERSCTIDNKVGDELGVDESGKGGAKERIG